MIFVCLVQTPTNVTQSQIVVVLSVEEMQLCLFSLIVNHVCWVFSYHIVQLYCVVMTHDEKLAQWTSEKLRELISACEMKETRAALRASIPHPPSLSLV